MIPFFLKLLIALRIVFFANPVAFSNRPREIPAFFFCQPAVSRTI